MKQYPPPPSHIGEKKEIIDRDGKKVVYTIIDEIIEMQNEEKAVYLQFLEFDDKRTELRLAYWIIGSEEKRMAGKWTFGESAPMVPKDVFENIIRKAIEKNWISP